MFNVQKFYKDYNIPIAITGKHVRQGWVNVDCPFCRGDAGLGIHIESGAVKCWKCGKHSQIDVIKALLSLEYSQAKDIQDEYSTNERIKDTTGAKDKRREPRKTECVYPYGTTALTERHKAYLAGRDFDADHISEVWGLRGTGNIGDYKFRIIAPVTVNGVMVSYQGRDITGKAPLRYKACKQDDEVIEHQTVVYGLDLVKGRACIVVEGIADCWRLGAGAVCCFGIAFTMEQANLLAERFETVYILFDTEELAQKQARELAVLLSARGVEVELLTLEEGDPGEMPQDEADCLMAELGLKN